MAGGRTARSPLHHAAEPRPYETECHRMQHPVGPPLPPPPHPPMPAVPPPPGPEAAAHFAAPVPEAAHAAVALLLIGPAGAGKTTVARHWADTRRVPTAHISLDDVREWVRSGFADPQSGWNDHSEAQYRLARRTCGFAARNFLANGISCVLDDAVFPDRPVVGLGGWKRHVGPGLLPVVLLPGLEIVLERNAERTGNRRLGDEEVARIHGRMAGWYGSGLPIIDNSQQDVATTARLLDDIVARAATAAPPGW
ncbi:AAA family ATPase [Streptomyces sp. NPDC002537]